MTTICLKPGRKFCRLGDLSTSIGWKYGEFISKQEEIRKASSEAAYRSKLHIKRLRKEIAAELASELAPINEALAQYGY